MNQSSFPLINPWFLSKEPRPPVSGGEGETVDSIKKLKILNMPYSDFMIINDNKTVRYI
jgi:hypothetical protein